MMSCGFSQHMVQEATSDDKSDGETATIYGLIEYMLTCAMQVSIAYTGAIGSDTVTPEIIKRGLAYELVSPEGCRQVCENSFVMVFGKRTESDGFQGPLSDEDIACMNDIAALIGDAECALKENRHNDYVAEMSVRIFSRAHDIMMNDDDSSDSDCSRDGDCECDEGSGNQCGEHEEDEQDHMHISDSDIRRAGESDNGDPDDSEESAHACAQFIREVDEAYDNVVAGNFEKSPFSKIVERIIDMVLVE
jgi:hypothetical protein